MQLQQEVTLAPFTTFGIGGPARWFVDAESEQAILEAVRFARGRELPLFTLGGGSNVVISDQGFPGLVIRIASRGVEQEDDLFHVAAGESWDDFVSLATAGAFGGIECLAGIPGTVGGTPVQNVGAYGQEVATTIHSVRVLDLSTLLFSEISGSGCGFAYRRSIFNTSHRGRFIVTRVTYRLRKDALPILSYADVKKYFEDHLQPPSVAETASAVREIRRRKGMLLVPGDSDCRSAGSFFKNPVIQESLYERIASAASVPVPHYGAEPGLVKIPAAWLVEHAGFAKGFSAGPAGISTRHSLALVNRGGATAHDIVSLAGAIVAAVEQKFGVRLEPEPVFLGIGEPPTQPL